MILRRILLDLGFDSLLLTQASTDLKRKFGIRITFRQFYDEAPTVETLSQYIEKLLPSEFFHEEEAIEALAQSNLIENSNCVASDRRLSIPGADNTAIDRNIIDESAPEYTIKNLVKQQIQLNSNLLKILEGRIWSQKAQSKETKLPEQKLSVSKEESTSLADSDLDQHGPFKGIKVEPDGGLTSTQENALATLTAQYNKKTAASKKYAQQHRDHFCDPRAAGNFRQLWKEMVYPIVCARSQYGKIWDIDGNEYVDVTLGFGANYFGHRPGFIVKALEAQMRKGFEIGPQSPLAGEVAYMLCGMTGMERATFCNTGSEAVMAAIRVSRTVTARDKIVYFTGSYHGMFDEVLGQKVPLAGRSDARPIAPGIPALPNIIILEYGSESSLQTIEQRANEIAAVIVEPVQSRHPALQPRDFLIALRELTLKKEILLIFDEVVTGFRAAPGGAQEYFGISADLATYGKILGGGMPIGALAGKKQYMDALDGGSWQFGDDSYPEVGVTFFAGTFVRHPFAMAAAHATLRYLNDVGPSLQQKTNEKTAGLVDSLNLFLKDHEVPIRLQTFSSLIYYDFDKHLKYAPLLFYFMRNCGIHVWEGRLAQVCTTHTDDDLKKVNQAFKDSIRKMQAGGFLPRRKSKPMESTQSADLTSSLHGEIVGEPETTILPSQAQREMWLGAQMRLEASGPHHACTGVWLDGPLDIKSFRKSIGLVLERHESLRSTFSADGAVIFVHSPNHFEQLFIEDFRDLSESDRKAQTQAVLHQESRRLLDIENGPLVTFKLLRLRNDQHLLIFKVQMIVCDGWSHHVVFEDIADAYSAYTTGVVPKLKPPVQMREFSRWQQRPETLQEIKENEIYWISQFRHIPSVLNLPTSQPRLPTRTFDAKRCSVTIDALLFQKIHRIARKQRKSFFVILLATYQVWLHRLSGCCDLVVGVPFAAQAPLRLDRLVGQCANVLPIRATIEPGKPFTTLLSHTWSNIIDAQDNWNFTFGQLASKLDMPYDPSRIPLVSVLFNLDAAKSKVKFERLRHRFVSGPRYYYQYDLGFNLVEEEDTIQVECNYNTSLFEYDLVHTWTTGYLTLLEEIVHDPDRLVGQLSMMDASEIPYWASSDSKHEDKKISKGTLLHELIAFQASRKPEAIAVESDGYKLSYQELEQQSERLAAKLRQQGIGLGNIVGVCLKRSAKLPVALLGVLKTGAAYLAIDPVSSTAQLSEIITGNDLKDTVVDAFTANAFTAIALRQLDIEDLLTGIDEPPVDVENPVAENISETELACVTITSGFNGNPKGVAVTHGAMVNMLMATQVEPGFATHDVMLAANPVSDSGFGLELWLPLTIGARTVIAPCATTLDPTLLGTMIEKHGVTVMQATPSVWQRLVRSDWAGNGQLRAWSSGQTLRSNLAGRLLILCRELWNLYSSPETAGCCMASRVKPSEAISLGRPLAGMSIWIVDDLLQAVPAGVPGEIIVAGNGLAQGYLGQPDLTAQCFITNSIIDGRSERVYRSGDLARYTADGRIEFVGRKDAQVEVRGFRFDLGDIEAAIEEHEAVWQSVVILHEDTSGNPLVVGYATVDNESTGAEELGDFLRKQLPNYMVPFQIIILKAFPLLPVGKIDQRLLPIPDKMLADAGAHRRNRDVAFVAPQTPIEMKLADIWKQVLRIPQIGIHDNFFELGGQSMLVMKVVLEAGKMGFALKPRSIFLNPTIEKLARVADQSVNGPVLSTEHILSPTGPVPLTAAQIRFLQERNTFNPNRWNFSKLLKADDLNPAIVKASLKALVAHHDSLRLRLSEANGEWTQVVGDSIDDELFFESRDLSKLNSEAQNARIEAVCEELQGSLDLSDGPVFRAAHFSCGSDRSDRLFVVMHHFVMDFFSWDVFIEDLESAYRQCLAGNGIVLPPKTTSFREYSLRLRDVARSAEIQALIPRWFELPWDQVGKLPLDFAANPSANTNESACDHELLINAEESRSILNPAGNRRTDEIILAALAQTLGEWTASSAVLIDCLNHGRLIVDDADLTRTVGFMLCYQPVVVQIANGSEPKGMLSNMVDQIRRLPEGFSFDLLRFFSEEESDEAAFDKLPRPEVLFNFFGRQEESEIERTSMFSTCEGGRGSAFDPRNVRYYPLAISAVIVDKGLRFRFAFSRNLHQRSSIKQLSSNFRKRLIEFSEDSVVRKSIKN